MTNQYVLQLLLLAKTLVVSWKLTAEIKLGLFKKKKAFVM
jgi:hypothetical protein